MTKAEYRYTMRQSSQICSQCGFIGSLYGVLGRDDVFLYNWETYNKALKTKEFIDEFEEVVNYLKSNILKNCESLYVFCNNDVEQRCTSFSYDFFGTVIECDDFIHLITIYDNEIRIHSYKTVWFLGHLQDAEKNKIRFITSGYDTICFIEDGEFVTILNADGSTDKYECRYIDNYHTEICGNIYHICEFAELLEKGNRRVIERKD